MAETQVATVGEVEAPQEATVDTTHEMTEKNFC